MNAHEQYCMVNAMWGQGGTMSLPLSYLHLNASEAVELVGFEIIRQYLVLAENTFSNVLILTVLFSTVFLDMLG